MPQQFLDLAKVALLLHQPHRKGMPQHPGRDSFVQTNRADRAAKDTLEHHLDGALVHGAVVAAQKHRANAPLSDPSPHLWQNR